MCCVYIFLRGGGQRRGRGKTLGSLPSTFDYHYNSFAHILQSLESSAAGNLKQKAQTRSSSSIYFTLFKFYSIYFIQFIQFILFYSIYFTLFYFIPSDEGLTP